MAKRFSRSDDGKSGSAWLGGSVSIKSQKLNNYGTSGADKPPLSGDAMVEGENKPHCGDTSVATIIRK